MELGSGSGMDNYCDRQLERHANNLLEMLPGSTFSVLLPKVFKVTEKKNWGKLHSELRPTAGSSSRIKYKRPNSTLMARLIAQRC